MATAYYTDERTKRYTVTIHRDHHPSPFDWGDATFETFPRSMACHSTITDVRERDLREWVESNPSQRKDGKRFLVTNGRPGHVQGQYGYKLAESWRDHIVGVLEVPADYINPENPRGVQGWLDEYTSWAFGDVYGIVVAGECGNVVDSCWGYIGDEWAQANARETFLWWNSTLAAPESFEVQS